MEHKLVGKVTPQESKEIRRLFFRKAALLELVHTFTREEFEGEPGALHYERFLQDLGETVTAYDAWWERIQKTYGWPPGKYSIDFDSCEIRE